MFPSFFVSDRFWSHPFRVRLADRTAVAALPSFRRLCRRENVLIGTSARTSCLRSLPPPCRADSASPAQTAVQRDASPQVGTTGGTVVPFEGATEATGSGATVCGGEPSCIGSLRILRSGRLTPPATQAAVCRPRPSVRHKKSGISLNLSPCRADVILLFLKTSQRH